MLTLPPISVNHSTFKMAAVRHISKFTMLVTRPSSACDFAFSYKTLPKSDYWMKTLISKCRLSAILSLENIEFWSSDCHLCHNSLLCSEFQRNRTTFHRDMTIQLFSKMFLIVTFVGMPFCFLLQNLAEIGQPVAQLWLKTIFNMVAGRHLEF